MLVRFVQQGGTYAHEQRALLENSGSAPHLLDAAAVARMREVFTRAATDNEQLAEQGCHRNTAGMGRGAYR